jgi:TonB family protein
MPRTTLSVVAAVVLMTTPIVAGQDSLAAARDLYASAAYEDALALLSRLPESNRPADETRSIEQYRAFCLLALGRTAEAEHSIEAVVAGEPTYRPATDLSPRVRAAFTDVRKRVLPAIIQQKYADAKARYDRKEFAAAATAFGQVIDVMNDPDLGAAAGQSPLSDLRTLANGFKDLATTAAAPPPAPAPPTPAPVAAPPPPPPPPHVYSPNESTVIPPATLKQELPSYPGTVPFARQGIIEIIVDENGAVETAVMRQSVTNAYDALALAAARTWRYRPATLNGVPVKYRKSVQVTIKPSAGNAR